MTSWRRDRERRLPADWKKIRARILRRDPTCQLRLDVCTILSTEVDHIGANTDHRESMLRGVCSECHRERTQDQSRAAIRKRSRRRTEEQHPGVIADVTDPDR